jgi:hypothetical protein
VVHLLGSFGALCVNSDSEFRSIAIAPADAETFLAFQVQDIQLEAIMIFKAPNLSSLYGVKMVPIPLEAHANFIRAVTVAAETSFAQSGFMRDV